MKNELYHEHEGAVAVGVELFPGGHRGYHNCVLWVKHLDDALEWVRNAYGKCRYMHTDQFYLDREVGEFMGNKLLVMKYDELFAGRVNSSWCARLRMSLAAYAQLVGEDDELPITCDGDFRKLLELPFDATSDQLSRAVYRSTSCGGWAEFLPGNVGVKYGTIVEGSEAEYHEELRYPFYPEEWKQVWDYIERWADEQWHLANDDAGAGDDE